MSSTDLKDELKTMAELFPLIPARLSHPLELNRGNRLYKGKWVHCANGKTYSLSTYFASNKFKLINVDDRRRISDELRDYKLFRMLERKTLTAADIMRCRNIEIRQYLLQEYGFERFMSEIGGKVIHLDGTSKLIAIEWGNGEGVRAVRVKDSTTGKYYLLRVPPTVKTCKEAVAWTFDVNVKDYVPKVET